MKNESFVLRILIAVINVVIIGFFSYLTVFMYKNNLERVDDFLGKMVITCLLLSVISKLFITKNIGFIISVISDGVLILILYNLTEYSSFMDFMNNGLFSIQSLIVACFSSYLVYFHYYFYKKNVGCKIER